MQPSRTRLICRAHNRFTPSIALWQHFVVPNRPYRHQQCLSSLAIEAAYNSTPEDARLLTSQEASGLEQLEAQTVTAGEGNGKPQAKIRKLTTDRGTWHSSKVEASSARNAQIQSDKRQASLTEPERLLAATKTAFDLAKDYKGVNVQPMVNPRPIKESKLPWCLKPEERTMSGIDRLAIEIERFHEYARPDSFESIARKHLVEQMRNHVRKFLPDHVLEVFGSERTGISLATSDIDLRLIRQSVMADPATAKLPPTPSERSEGMKSLRSLHRNLDRHKAYMLCNLRHARYPLISLQDRQSGLDVQIVLSNDTSLSRDIMQRYMEEYPYLRQLYYVVKCIFDVRGLSDVFRGGFGSYSLFMMLVATIRHNPHPRNDAAGGLINFWKFWPNFDTKKQGVSIEPVVLFDKVSEPILTDTIKSKLEEGAAKPLPDYMLSLRDPADETNDLGRKGIAIKHVQVTLFALAQQLEFDMKVNTRYSILGPVVGPSYMLARNQRSKLQSYGQRLLDQMRKSLAVKAKAIRDEDNQGKDREEVNKEVEEEETKQRLAQEERDREWRRMAKERDEKLRLEAERASVLEHGEAMASILGMPSVEEDQEANNDIAATEGSAPIVYTPAEETKEPKSS